MEMKNTDDGSPITYASLVQQANKTELTNTTGTQLQHMNEDCLLEIFSSKSLTPMDLCALAETCTRFKQITQRVFPKEFSIRFRYEDVYEFKSKDYLGNKKSARDVDRIFKNFGSCLAAFSFSCRGKTHVFDLLPKYCVGGTLERLTIDLVDIPEVLAVKLKPIFKQLQRLVINSFSIEGGKNIFANCDSLTELEVVYGRNADAILENIFPKLERFRLWYFPEQGIKLHEMKHFLSIFISRHKSLKTLKLENTAWTGRILQKIGNNCKELEELEIKITSLNVVDYVSALHALNQLKELKIGFGCVYKTKCIQQLQSLKSLEILKIDCAYGSNFDTEFIPALALLTNLRELHLIECYALDLSQLTLLTQLTKLYLRSVETITNEVDVIRRLTNLQELTIIDDKYFVLCKKSFSEIVEIVKGRPHVLTLKCKFNFFYNSKNSKIKNQNVKLIKIRKD